MRARYKVATAATGNVLDVDNDIKPYIGINASDTYWDTRLATASKQAEYEAETYMRRILLTSTWDAYFDGFCREFKLERTPVTAVSYIKYQDPDNSTQTLSTSNYSTDIVSYDEGMRIKILNAPSIYTDGYNAVNIRFVAGYSDSTAVPQGIKEALLARVGTLYRINQTVFVGTQVNELPLWFEKMLNPYKIDW